MTTATATATATVDCSSSSATSRLRFQVRFLPLLLLRQRPLSPLPQATVYSYSIFPLKSCQREPTRPPRPLSPGLPTAECGHGEVVDITLGPYCEPMHLSVHVGRPGALRRAPAVQLCSVTGSRATYFSLRRTRGFPPTARDSTLWRAPAERTTSRCFRLRTEVRVSKEKLPASSHSTAAPRVAPRSRVTLQPNQAVERTC